MAATIQPNTLTTDLLLTSTGGNAYDLGFIASYLRVENRSGSPLRVNVNSSVSSTDGERVGPMEMREWTGLSFARFNIATTSTTTATGNVATRREAWIFAAG